LIKIIAKENKEAVSSLSDAKKKKYMKQRQERMMAMQLLMGADKCEFGSAIENLKNMYLLNKNNQYPKTLNA